MTSVVAALLAWQAPQIDFHFLAPEIVLTGVICLLLIVDVVGLERTKPLIAGLAGVGLLAALIPVVTLALSGSAVNRAMFAGGYVLDRPTLLLKAFFIVAGYVVVLLSTNVIAEGDYWESEYYILTVASVLGMVVMCSSRDLISIFVAFELLSIPTYMLGAWRKRDVRSTEAGMKYFLMGVFATGIMLYGMSLLYGISGSTLVSDIGTAMTKGNSQAMTLAIVFVMVGFGFKVSAVPFHSWAPDTYEGAPAPMTAFFAVASKAGGFVALINVVFYAFGVRQNVVAPIVFVLAALSMTVGNLIAIRQTNVVRMLAYSGIAQAGFILAPFAVTHQPDALSSVIIYIVIYGAMNLGAFGVIIALARKTGSAERSSMAGAFQFAPGLTVAMTIFMASLAGIPPMGGWYAKFGVSRVLVAAHTGWGYALAIVLAVNTVIGAFYYMRILATMWVDEPADGDVREVRVPPAVVAAVAICTVATLLFGIMPGLVSDATKLALGG
jgi:NADH-quinone oxidoreductase subunit N